MERILCSVQSVSISFFLLKEISKALKINVRGSLPPRQVLENILRGSSIYCWKLDVSTHLKSVVFLTSNVFCGLGDRNSITVSSTRSRHLYLSSALLRLLLNDFPVHSVMCFYHGQFSSINSIESSNFRDGLLQTHGQRLTIRIKI